jgi:hypothetical protein
MMRQGVANKAAGRSRQYIQAFGWHVVLSVGVEYLVYALQALPFWQKLKYLSCSHSSQRSSYHVVDCSSHLKSSCESAASYLVATTGRLKLKLPDLESSLDGKSCRLPCRFAEGAWFAEAGAAPQINNKPSNNFS